MILQYELGNFLSKWELLKISYYKDDIAVQIGELSLKMEAHQRLVSLREYIFLHAIIGRNGFEEEQNLPRDNFSLSAIRLLSAERSEARHV